MDGSSVAENSLESVECWLKTALSVRQMIALLIFVCKVPDYTPFVNATARTGARTQIVGTKWPSVRITRRYG